MVRENIDYYSILEAQEAWKRPLMDVVQLAGNGTIAAYCLADHWNTKTHQIVDGWVTLKQEEILKGLNKDNAVITFVKFDKQWLELESPQTLRWGQVYVDAETFAEYLQKAQDVPASLEPLLTRGQLAKILNIQPETISKWKGTKGPKAIKIGNTVRYRQSDVEAYIRSLEEDK